RLPDPGLRAQHGDPDVQRRAGGLGDRAMSVPRSARVLGLAPLLALLLAAIPAAAGVGPCPVLPANNIWNTRVGTLPVHPSSAAFISSIGAGVHLHPDFGAGFGIPFIAVAGSQPKVPINYTDFGDESDPGPFPIPPNAPIEGGAASDGDRHVLVIDVDNCIL